MLGIRRAEQTKEAICDECVCLADCKDFSGRWLCERCVPQHAESIDVPTAASSNAVHQSPADADRIAATAAFMADTVPHAVGNERPQFRRRLHEYAQGEGPELLVQDLEDNTPESQLDLQQARQQQVYNNAPGSSRDRIHAALKTIAPKMTSPARSRSRTPSMPSVARRYSLPPVPVFTESAPASLPEASLLALDASIHGQEAGISAMTTTTQTKRRIRSKRPAPAFAVPMRRPAAAPALPPAFPQGSTAHNNPDSSPAEQRWKRQGKPLLEFVQHGTSSWTMDFLSTETSPAGIKEWSDSWEIGG